MKTFTSWAMAFAFAAMVAQGAAPSPQDFEQLNALMQTATKKLDGTKSADKIAATAKEIAKLAQQLKQNENMMAAAGLDPKNCPAELKEAYQQSLAIKMTMQDAAKRLAMGGIMQGKSAEPYIELLNLIAINDPNVDVAPLNEGAPPETKEQRDARMQWWRDGKFGMFIHYGLFSALAGEALGKEYPGCVEWIQMYANLDTDTYVKESLPRLKYKKGNAAEWVKLAKEAGCTYTVLTSRHHEGFNMFDSSQFNKFNFKTE